MSKRVLSTKGSIAFAAAALASFSLATPQQSVQIGNQTPANGPIIIVDPPAATSAPFRNLTNDFSDVVNFNIETTRGMVLWGANQELWAINTHGSTLNKFVGLAVEPQEKYPTLNNPVAIALWEDNLLVVGAASNAMALHDRLTGRILEVVVLDSEPFDLIVDEDNDKAYVSCQGTDTVCVVDLATMTVEDRVKFLLERPGFMYFETNDPLDGTDNEIFLAPEVSGNNTMTFGNASNGIILDGKNTNFFVEGLPDIDLVKFDCATLTITELGRSLFTQGGGHGKNPVTGAYWHLGVDSHNEQFNSEPAANGIFQDNTLSIVDDYSTGMLPKSADTTIITDVVDSLVGGNPKSVSMPWNLEFDVNGGGAWVISSTGHFIAGFDSTGTRLPAADLHLDPGSIPRQVLRTGNLLLVYCWGSNEIHVVSIGAATFNQIIVTLNLGHDPHHEQVQAGRAVFYDADNSLDHKVTCGSCHPGGGGDSLAWNIQDSPVDDKGPMVTQTLFGIFDNFPHHWRGERTLEDFNVAFPGLLGGALLDATPGAEQDQFGAFVNGLTPFANPNIHISRKIKDFMTDDPLEDGSVGSAVAGDIVFHDIPSDGTGACVECHAGPTSSSGDIVPENQSLFSERTHIEIMQLDNQIELKDQPVVDVELTAGGTFPFQLLGSGWAHNGTIRSLLGFLQFFGALTPQQQSDCTTFIKQFDTGVAPTVHSIWRLRQSSPTNLSKRIRGQLLNQALKRWCGAIAVGTVQIGDAERYLSWYYNVHSGLFHCEDPAVDAKPFKFFADQAKDGTADMIFMGTAPGNEFRLGVDYDNDGLINLAEAPLGTDPYVADFDLDGFEDGYEVRHGSDPNDELSLPSDSAGPQIKRAQEDFTVANLSKWHFLFNEKTRPEFTFSTGGELWSFRAENFALRHTVVFQHREASTIPGQINTFLISGKLTDMSGNETILADFDMFDADSMLHIGEFLQVVIGDIQFTSQTTLGPGSVDLTTEVQVDFKEFGPPATPAEDFVVIGQVLAKNTTSGLWEVNPNVTYAGPTEFIWDAQNEPPVDLYAAQPGPWVVFDSTDAAGLTSANVQVGGLTAGQEVMMNIKFIHPAPEGWVFPAVPPFAGGAPNLWDKPTTLPKNRNVVTTF